ncbi:uncharacterized protein LOC132285018 [Cornus florida]|uniref:uncharacterized protein LOC132285018 n=1 Tax=Cornus florida TaxID=4283 RepID=UPI0028997891|nr:uncharacterized protein LOC132285018 [Cornus florida]
MLSSRFYVTNCTRVVTMAVNKKEDNLQAVWFAAGTAVLMACLKRATVVSLVEQWRVWVFLALNLLLLAILFTSTSSTNQPQESNYTNEEPNTIERKKRRKQCMRFLLEDEQGSNSSMFFKSTGIITRTEKEVVEEDDDVKQISLSKEELNEKAEAFIAMFRRHLISDAKNRSRSPSQTRRRPHTEHPGQLI